jgi:hypothetical protein
MAGVGVLCAEQHAQQGRLALAVTADQTNTLAGFDAQIGMVQQRLVAVGEGDLIEVD